MKITIYTDGSSRGNPGRGGWGAVIIAERRELRGESGYNDRDEEVIELGGRENMTTNNRMELMGAIMGLREIDGRSPIVDSNTIMDSSKSVNRRPQALSVEVCTDSQYVKKGITEWIDGWIKRGWKGSTKKPVLNRDLWEDLKKEEDRLKDGGVQVTWKYVPGHSGVPLNERADVIATMCADDASDLQLYRGLKSDYTF